MTNSKIVKEELEKEDKELGSGEGTIGSGSVDLEEDDDVGEAFSKYIGHEPSGGDTLSSEVDASEDSRRGKPVHEEDNNK